jgi:hypothetical protein
MADSLVSRKVAHVASSSSNSVTVSRVVGKQTSLSSVQHENGIVSRSVTSTSHSESVIEGNMKTSSRYVAPIACTTNNKPVPTASRTLLTANKSPSVQPIVSSSSKSNMTQPQYAVQFSSQGQYAVQTLGAEHLGGGQARGTGSTLPVGSAGGARTRPDLTGVQPQYFKKEDTNEARASVFNIDDIL